MRLITWNVNGIKTLLQYHPWNALKTYEGIMSELGADITCLQETKITRAQMDRGLACMSSFDSFFSFYNRTAKGIHGTAIFTKRESVVPIKAEEGLSSELLPSSGDAAERIGGYPLSSDLDLELHAMRDLDAEGRTTVCDFGMFVLINLYCPNETNDERLVFKNYFNDMVDRRVRNLVQQGRQVIVVGDLNICHSPIDSAEANVRTKAQGLERFIDHPPRKWLNEFVGPDGPMIDITRRLHPDRKGMYTCWNTKIDARPSNYGTRLDYILITPGLLPWVKDSDILPKIVGSDHCPVYLDFHDTVEVDGNMMHLWDELNPGRDSSDRTAGPEPPKFASKFYDEFSGKQKSLLGFFRKKSDMDSPSPAPSTASTNSEPSTAVSWSTASTSSMPVASTSTASPPTLHTPAPKTDKIAPKPFASSSVLAANTVKPKNKGKEKEVVKEKPGQQTIASFFKAHALVEPPKTKAKKKKKVARATREEVLIIEDSPEPVRSPTSSTVDHEDARPDESEYDMAIAASQAEAASAWANIFTPRALPNCHHGEPTKLWVVNKPGINKGRRFYLCQRPVGPGYDKGQPKLHVNTEFRCDFFGWETSVKRPASMAPSSASKRQK